MPLESFAGGLYYLVEVIAFVLSHLKDELMKHLSTSGFEFSPMDFEWVITMPAIWKAGGKQMMREAAYLVRYLSFIFRLLMTYKCSKHYTSSHVGSEYLCLVQYNPYIAIWLCTTYKLWEEKREKE